MSLLTTGDRESLPPLYSQDGRGTFALAYVKFFDPCSPATWYASEFDGEDTFFGLCDLGFGEPELGYFSLSELESIRGRLGIGIGRDRHWVPRSLRSCHVSGVLR